MALLIDIGLPDWMSDEALKGILEPMLPGVEIHCGSPSEMLPDVIMVTVTSSFTDVWTRLPNLKLIQKLGAGVNQILDAPNLPEHIRVARLAPELQAIEIAEYCLAFVLQYQRNLSWHEVESAQKRWTPIAPRRTDQTTVGVLGLGHIGARTARLFAQFGYRVLGWSRTPKTIEGVDCRAGNEALPQILGECDYVVSILPSTPQTTDLFDAPLIARMKTGAVLINVGRGDLIVEKALIAALDEGRLTGAVIDVFRKEPPPSNDPLWEHPKVVITPHVSGWHVDGGFEDVAENYRRLIDKRPLLHEVNRALGY